MLTRQPLRIRRRHEPARRIRRPQPRRKIHQNQRLHTPRRNIDNQLATRPPRNLLQRVTQDINMPPLREPLTRHQHRPRRTHKPRQRPATPLPLNTPQPNHNAPRGAANHEPQPAAPPPPTTYTTPTGSGAASPRTFAFRERGFDTRTFGGSSDR